MTTKLTTNDKLIKKAEFKSMKLMFIYNYKPGIQLNNGIMNLFDNFNQHFKWQIIYYYFFKRELSVRFGPRSDFFRFFLKRFQKS